MKVRILIGALLAAVLLSQASVGTAQKRRKAEPTRPQADAWYVFTNPDGDFSLSFPGKPTLNNVGPGPLTDLREAEFVTKDGLRFAINFHDVGGDPHLRENNRWMPQLEQISSDIDRSQGLRVIQMHRLAPHIIEAEIWQRVPETSSTIKYLRRSIIRRARVYTLACGWVIDAKPVDTVTCRRFFTSMRLTKNASNSQVLSRKSKDKS